MVVPCGQLELIVAVENTESERFSSGPQGWMNRITRLPIKHLTQHFGELISIWTSFVF